MGYLASLLLGAWVTAAGAATTPSTSGGMPCLSHRPSPQQLQSLDNLIITQDYKNTTSNVVIDTYVHIVASDNSERGGYLSAKTIDQQMKVLSDDFSSTGFSFRLIDTDYTINSNWAAGNDELGMKRRLRKGQYSTLNLYYLGNVESKFSGDGCVQGAWTVPGRGTRFSLGRITTHEVGHWLYLIHTFEGGCNGGDQVDDTPAEASPASGCPEGRDTCSAPGMDPIHNHMDYTDDSCRTEFTRGQIARMQRSWEAYRQGK